MGKLKNLKELEKLEPYTLMGMKFNMKHSLKAVGCNFKRPKGVITSLTSITSELAEVQLLINEAM